MLILYRFRVQNYCKLSEKPKKLTYFLRNSKEMSTFAAQISEKVTNK